MLTWSLKDCDTLGYIIYIELASVEKFIVKKIPVPDHIATG